MHADQDPRLAEERDREVYAIRRLERELDGEERRLERRLDGLEEDIERTEVAIDRDREELDPGGRPDHTPFWDDDADPRARALRHPNRRR